MVRMVSSSRLKGKLRGGCGCERCRLRPLAASADAVRIPKPLLEGTGDVLRQGFGVVRELEEEEVEEEEEDGEIRVVKELNEPSSSSVSITEGSPTGTGVQGCQPGATEQDLTS